MVAVLDERFEFTLVIAQFEQVGDSGAEDGASLVASQPHRMECSEPAEFAERFDVFIVALVGRFPDQSVVVRIAHDQLVDQGPDDLCRPAREGTGLDRQRHLLGRDLFDTVTEVVFAGAESLSPQHLAPGAHPSECRGSRVQIDRRMGLAS